VAQKLNDCVRGETATLGKHQGEMGRKRLGTAALTLTVTVILVLNGKLLTCDGFIFWRVDRYLQDKLDVTRSHSFYNMLSAAFYTDGSY